MTTHSTSHTPRLRGQERNSSMAATSERCITCPRDVTRGRRPHAGDMLKNLVIPLDGSEFAAHALPTGIELAAAANAAVRVIGIAPTDAELAMTYDHVHEDAKRAGLDPKDVEVRVDPEPVKVLLEFAALEDTTLCMASHDR